jgi:hypothetical protein
VVLEELRVIGALRVDVVVTRGAHCWLTWPMNATVSRQYTEC